VPNGISEYDRLQAEDEARIARSAEAGKQARLASLGAGRNPCGEIQLDADDNDRIEASLRIRLAEEAGKQARLASLGEAAVQKAFCNPDLGQRWEAPKGDRQLYPEALQDAKSRSINYNIQAQQQFSSLPQIAALGSQLDKLSASVEDARRKIQQTESVRVNLLIGERNKITEDLNHARSTVEAQRVHLVELNEMLRAVRQASKLQAERIGQLLATEDQNKKLKLLVRAGLTDILQNVFLGVMIAAVLIVTIKHLVT
jgi:hypothetical protein